jgi:hypothetical protein
LGGLSFAALATLAVAQVPRSPLPRSTQADISWAVAFLLTASTVLFLLTAYGAYTSIRLVTREPMEALRARYSGTLPEQNKAERAMTSEESFRRALEIHHGASGFVTWGLIALVSALLLIAFEISVYYVFLPGLLVVVILVSWRLRDLVVIDWRDLVNALLRRCGAQLPKSLLP